LKSRRKNSSLEGLVRLIARERSVHELLNRIVEEGSYLRLCQQIYSQANDSRFQAELARIGKPYGLEAEGIRRRITPILQALQLVEETEGPWGILGLSPGASSSEIKKAYRRLSLQYHPDHNQDDPEAEEHFLKIRLAYELVSRDPSGKAAEPSLGWLEDQPPEQARERRGISHSFLWQVGLAVTLLLVASVVMDWLYPSMVFKEHKTPQQTQEPASGNMPPSDSPSPAAQSIIVSTAPKKAINSEPQEQIHSTEDLSEKNQVFSSVQETLKENIKNGKFSSPPLTVVEKSPVEKSTLLAKQHSPASKVEPSPVRQTLAKPPESRQDSQEPREKTTPPVRFAAGETEQRPQTSIKENQPSPPPKPALVEKLPGPKPTAKAAPKKQPVSPESRIATAALSSQNAVSQPHTDPQEKRGQGTVSVSATPKPAEPPSSGSPASPLQEASSRQTAQQLKEVLAKLTPGKEKGFQDLESQLEAFLAAYSSAYRSKDIAAFGNFFTTDAQENGVPIKNLLPVYAQDFTMVTIREYSIRLQSWQDMGTSIHVAGMFALSMLWNDGKTGNYRGAISMRLRSKNDTFKVEQLDYTYQ